MKKRMSLAVSLVVFAFFIMSLSVFIGRLCTYLRFCLRDNGHGA